MDTEEWTYILNLTYVNLKWLSRKTNKSDMIPPEKYGSGWLMRFYDIIKKFKNILDNNYS